jgi:hypothetical protein
MVGRIEHGQSIDVVDVVVFDADGNHRSADYNPLAVHASAAVTSRLVGADAGSALMAFTVLFAAIVLRMGMFALARPLAPACRLSYNARWIFLDERGFLLTKHVLQLDMLRRNGGVSEVFHRGPVHVFSIRPA